MPIYTEILTKFTGKGSKKIYDWAQDGSEGVFFARVFGYDYENATEDDWKKWESDFTCFRLGETDCSAEKKKGNSVLLHMLVCGSIPYGVFEKIAETFPEIHADGRFIQQAEEFFGNVVIEKGGFLWTKFDNTGRRSGKKDFVFDSFFREPDEEPDMDKMQKEVLELLKFDRDNMRYLLSKGEPKAKKPEPIEYHSKFYFSEQELKAIAGDADIQYQIAQEMTKNEFFDNNPKIYNKKDKIERECCEQYFEEMARSWLKKAALNGNVDAQIELSIRCIGEEDYRKAKEWYIAFSRQEFGDELDYDLGMLEQCNEDDDLLSLLEMICWFDDADTFDFTLQRSGLSIEDTSVEYPFSYDELTLLGFAARHGAMAIVRLLIEKYKVTYINDNTNERSLVRLAARSGNIGLLEYLIEDCGLDSHFAVHDAAIEGNVEASKWFIEKAGIDINEQNPEGETPLHCALCACLSGALSLYDLGSFEDYGPEFVKWFLDNGADPNTRTEDGTLLHEAIGTEEPFVVEYLIDAGADVNATDEKGDTPLLEAVGVFCGSAQSYVFEQIRCLIDNGADVNCFDNIGYTPLHIAAEFGNEEMVKYFIEECHMDPDISDGNGSPLLKASREGHLPIVEFLVDKGADIYCCDEDGYTGLHFAALFGNGDIVRYFIEKCGMDPNWHQEGGDIAVNCAAYGNHTEIVKWLINDAGVGINERGGEGGTPLHSAMAGFPDHAENYDFGLVKWLVENGADVNCYDDNGYTPFSKAFFYRFSRAVRYFVKEIKDLDISAIGRILDVFDPDESQYRNALRFLENQANNNSIPAMRVLINHYAYEDEKKYIKWLKKAVDCGDVESINKGLVDAIDSHIESVDDSDDSEKYLDLVKYLVEHGGDINFIDEDGGWSFLRSAVWNSDWILADYLIDAGADINLVDDDGYTALSACVVQYSALDDEALLEFVKKMVAHGADVKTMEGALVGAAEWGRLEVVRYFIEECHLDPNCHDQDGDTAILCAAKGENTKNETEDDHNIELIKWLVENGADINCFDDGKKTPLHIAAEFGNDIAIKYFIEECHMDPAINYGAGTPADLAKGNSTIVKYLHRIEKEYAEKQKM